jgi:hypothetical protein
MRGLRDPDRFDAWLRQFVVHSCIDITRRRRHRAVEVELTPIDGPTVADIASAIADRDPILDRTGLRTIVEPSSLVIANPRWSRDGTRIAYSAWAVDDNTNPGRVARSRFRRFGWTGAGAPSWQRLAR